MRDWAHSRRLGTPADEAGYVVLRQPPASKIVAIKSLSSGQVGSPRVRPRSPPKRTRPRCRARSSPAGPPPHRRPAGSSSAYQPELPQVSSCVILTFVPAQHFMEFDFMATKTVAAKPEPVGTAMLEQLADLDAKSISPETARKFLDLAFSRLQQERVHALSQKAREGSLTPTEGAELDELIRVADLLAILQSRARQALKHAGSPGGNCSEISSESYASSGTVDAMKSSTQAR